MPSIFSRSRTPSTPKKTTLDAVYDEFGRVTSRGSAKGPKSSASLAPSSIRKEKKKDAKDKSRARTISSPAEPDPSEYTLPDGSFLPLNLEPPHYEPGEEPSQEHRNFLDYGYLSYQRHVVLGLEEVARLVDVVGDELGTRGLTTPFIFSTLALDVSSHSLKRLIQAFLRTCGKPSHEADRLWREEARFAGPHELGMCLRWGLARVVRVVGGQEVRGLVSYDWYMQWREAEAALNYPATHFGAFIEPLPQLLRSLLVGLLTLLTRFTAHSSSSGHTPPTLSPLFGPLLFGLGPSTLAFHHVYVHYLRAATATEHLILSLIRWQDAPGRAGSSATALGVPTRLKAWIQGYPAMLPLTKKNERPQPRRGARTVRMVSVRRNVRMYSPDLVKTAASWAQRPRGATSSATDRSFAGSKEWDRISPPTLKLPPRYSDAYKKRMDLAPNFHPDTGAGSTSSSLSAPSLSASISTTSTTSSMFDDKEIGLLTKKPGEDRFRSLTDLKWGEFEAMGFGDTGSDEKKLQFDLTEGARAARAAKRATLTWQDFSTTGFSRNDAPLSATLQFSPPVANAVNAWPSQSAEIHRKLKKTQKSLPPFGWDTEPIMGGEEVIEEAFIDVFCDLVYGGGWMDSERAEDLQRDCNWALVEFKSLPLAKSNTVSGPGDPRTSTTLILFEEFVPLEYRQQLAESGNSRRRLPSLFGNSKKQWKPATTLNGRPYVIGHVPRSPSYREVEFEGLLRSNGSATKILSLKTPERRAPTITSPAVTSPASTIGSPFASGKPSLFLSPVTRAESPMQRPSSRQSDNESPSNSTSGHPHRRSSRFRLAVSPGGRTAGLPPSEYENVDFEARLASFSDDDLPHGGPTKHARGESRDDAWDAEVRNGLKGGRSDPELASQEVSEVLASLSQVQSDDDDDMEPVHRDGDDEDDEDDVHPRDSVVDDDTDRDTIPGPRVEIEEEDEEDEPPRPLMKKRMGYFDLHPERKNASLHSRSQSPLRQLEQPSYDDAHDHFEQQSVLEDPREAFKRHSLDSQSDSGHGEVHDLDKDRSSPPVPPKDLDVVSASKRDLPVIPPILDQVRAASPLATPPKVVSKPADPLVSKTMPSKTASLIELYRERERGTTSSPTSIPPSRLPVRTGASLQPPAEPVGRTSPSPSPPGIHEELEAILPQPVRPATNSGIITPPRYVHGAPLHNVLEEEEEEEL
ncbi:unnamed protein product [Somion occarium]|uniref:Meiotically up-regulated protein Msb1/Mug8 domain-containing protein n=1 Tax=Somion occarium TaxID=3059160 RepID=A0ABP1D1K1_9APHY